MRKFIIMAFAALSVFMFSQVSVTQAVQDDTGRTDPGYTKQTAPRETEGGSSTRSGTSAGSGASGTMRDGTGSTGGIGTSKGDSRMDTTPAPDTRTPTTTDPAYREKSPRSPSTTDPAYRDKSPGTRPPATTTDPAYRTPGEAPNTSTGKPGSPPGHGSTGGIGTSKGDSRMDSPPAPGTRQ